MLSMSQHNPASTRHHTRNPAQICVFCERIGRRSATMTRLGLMHKQPCFSDWRQEDVWRLIDFNTEAAIRAHAEAVRSASHKVPQTPNEHFCSLNYTA